MPVYSNNPFYRNPNHPNFNRRADHHDYKRPARYLITFLKDEQTPILSTIEGHPPYVSYESAITHLSPVGAFVPTAIEKWTELYPQIIVPAHAVMPDHVHLCVDVTSRLENGLSRAIGRLKGLISSSNHNSLPTELRPAEMQTLFAKGFNDRIAYDRQQWERQVHYTLDNPRRYMMKHDFPDYLTRRWIITVGNERYMAKGNIFLLKQPHLLQVKFSRKFSISEGQNWEDFCKKSIYNGSIPISPFIHSKEKEIRDFSIDNGSSYIRVCTNGFAERESAQGLEFHLMAHGRLLLIAPSEHDTRREQLRYSYAEHLNAVALRIATDFNSNLPGLIRPL